MNISEKTREIILREERSRKAKKAAKTLRAKFGKDYFKLQGRKGGLKSKRKG